MKAAQPERLGVAALALLVLTDLAAVSTLARCFSGPGELAVAVPCCLAAHLLAGGGRRLGRRTARPRLTSALAWTAGLLVAFYLPLALVDPGSFSGGLPLQGTWHLIDRQLAVALRIFSSRISPVREAPGLVLATGWVGGVVGLAAELLYCDAGLPALWALVPAFDVVVFAGTLGTSTGRAVEIAVICALGLGFLATAQGDRSTGRASVVMARAEAASARGKAAGRPGHKTALVPGVALFAALAAAVVGPVLPGATSAPLLSWHGSTPGQGAGGGGGAPSTGGPANRIEVDDLVEAAEEEIDNSDGLLLTVHARLRIRQSLLTLDHFDGVSWSAPSRPAHPVGHFPGRVGEIVRRPPVPVGEPDGSAEVTEAIEIGALGGSFLPAAGAPGAVDGDGAVSQEGGAGPLVSPSALRAGLTYAVRTRVPPDSGALLEAESPYGLLPGQEPAADLQLPGPLPSRLVSLAHRIVAGSTSEYHEASRLVDYFLHGHGFSYKLPARLPPGALSDTSRPYAALDSFLFSSKVGYCQQYATAFAVLARIDSIPARVAIGFLPGREVGRDQYLVTGSDVHAWPEVFFPHYGWVSFEPTPPAPLPAPAAPTGPGSPTPGPGGAGAATSHRAPNLHQLAKDEGSREKQPLGSERAPRQRGASGAVDILLALAVLAGLWVLVVPSWRLLRRRRQRRDGAAATRAAWAAASWALAAVSAHRRRAETNLEFAARVERLGLLSERANAGLIDLARRVDRSLYGPDEGAASRQAGAAALAEAAEVRRSACRRLSFLGRLVFLLDPRDLLGRT